MGKKRATCSGEDRLLRMKQHDVSVIPDSASTLPDTGSKEGYGRTVPGVFPADPGLTIQKLPNTLVNQNSQLDDESSTSFINTVDSLLTGTHADW